MSRHLDTCDLYLLWQFLDGNAETCESFGELARLVDQIADRVLARAVPTIAQAERKRAFVQIMTQLSTRN